MSKVTRTYPTQETLRELFDYQDGQLIRKVAASRRCKVGDVAGSMNTCGYLVTMVEGQILPVSRLVYILIHGAIPVGLVIDHIDSNRINNRIENLQAIKQIENVAKRSKNKNNTSGYRGVYFNKNAKKYMAKFTHNGKTIFLGYFEDLDEAATAHDQAAVTLVGEFAQTNFDIKGYIAA